RAEFARQRRAPGPVEAAVRYVDAEIVPLQHADAAHLDPARGLPRVPRRLDRNLDGHLATAAAVGDEVLLAALLQDERRLLRERLHDRHVHPDRLGTGGDDDLQSGSEAGAGAGDAASVLAGVAGGVDAHAAAEQLDLELDGFQHAREYKPRQNIAL